VGRIKLTPDVAHGKAAFEQQCSACHSTDPAAASRGGPNLHGVIGRVSGTLPGFKYSPAMQAAARTWSPRIVENFLADPDGLVPGTTMSAPPVTDRQTRTDIAGYLQSESEPTTH
jgi:cytochrome c